MTDENQRTRRSRISQEMIPIVTVGVALAGLLLPTTSNLRDEARADRAAWQAQSQKYRDDLQREILRLTRDQADLRRD